MSTTTRTSTQAPTEQQPGRPAPDQQAPSAARLVRTVAGREMSVKLRDKSFLVSTLVMLVIIAASVAIPILMAGRTSSYTVAVSGAAAEQVSAAAAELGSETAPTPSGASLMAGGVHKADITARPMSEADARAAVEAEDVDAAVIGDSLGNLTIVGRTTLPDTLVSLIDASAAGLQQNEAVAEAGLSDAQVTQLFDPALPSRELLETAPTGDVPPILVVMVFAFIYFISALLFGLSIAQSVVEEKQSRVVELLLAAMPVRWLLTGKVMGNTVMAFGQVILLVAVGLVGLVASGQGALVGLIAPASAWFIVFFVLGFIMLACLWAAAGALASRMEELNNSASTVQMLVMLPFFAAIFLQEPSTLQVVLSYVPFTSTLVMPARLLMGTAAWWEPILSAGIVGLTAWALVHVSVRLYIGSVMHTSSALKMSQAWKSTKAR